jgi:glycosyltransferase involved in cell wall biosynthesis
MHIIINGWFAGQEQTGSGQYLHHLLDTLPAFAPLHRWSLLLPTDDEALLLRWRLRWPQIAVRGVRLMPVPRQIAKLVWEQVTMPRMARQMAADVLWTPYWAAPLWQPCASVVTIHDLIPLLLPAYRGGVAQRLYNALVSWSARRSAAVLTVSHASARDVVTHLGVPTERVHAAPHGPNQEGSITPDAQQLADVRQRYRLPDRFFLYLGGFDVRKNVQGVLAAYQRYLLRGGDPAQKLVIAGKLPVLDSAFAPDPRKIAAELNLMHQIVFCGWVDESDKLALYALATAYIFPSFYEGFGMMVLEAMQAGAPVVVSDR